MTVTITHVYDDYDVAQDAVEDLEEAGFGSDKVSIVGRSAGSERNAAAPEEADGAATGATLGGVAGAGAGLLAALGVIAIPGIGPLVAAGVLAATLAGAATGAVAGGLIGALTDYGMSKEDAGLYAESVRRGGTLVSARVDESESQRVESIMLSHGPVDMNHRRQSYSEEGWTGYEPGATPYTSGEADAERARYKAAGITTPRT